MRVQLTEDQINKAIHFVYMLSQHAIKERANVLVLTPESTKELLEIGKDLEDAVEEAYVYNR